MVTQFKVPGRARQKYDNLWLLCDVRQQ